MIIFGIVAIVGELIAFGWVLWEMYMTPARELALWNTMDKIKKFFKN